MPATVTRATDDSWVHTPRRPVQNPFGSFRHRGAFPTSMLGTPGASGLASPAVCETSTHLYLNLMDCTDQGVVKTTRFWTDETCPSEDGSSSEFSSIHSDNSTESLAWDHRGDLDLELTFTQSLLVSAGGSDVRSPSVQRKVLPWLQAIQTPLDPASPMLGFRQRHCLEVQRSPATSNIHRTNKVFVSLNDIYDESDITQNASEAEEGPEGVFVPCSLESIPSGIFDDTGSSEIYHHSYKYKDLPMGSITDCSHFIENTLTNTQSIIDSEATTFMEHPMVPKGVTSGKFTNRRRSLLKKLKKLFRR